MAKILNKIKEKFKETPLVPTYGEMAANPTTPPTVQAPDKNGKLGDKIFAGIQNIGSMLGFNQGAQNSGTQGVQNGNTPEASAPSAQPSTQTSTHPDYYNQAINDINKAKEDALLYAKNAKEQAYEQAAINRESDMIKAANDYERAKAGYGAKAEMLASMGLTGSGYSDYLEAQAYAANRSDVQNAIAREAEAKRLADNQYDEMSYAANSEANKLTAETKLAGATYKEGVFNDLLVGAGNGTYSKDQIENLANMYGLSDSQKQALMGATGEYGKKNLGLIQENIKANPEYYSDADYQKLVEQGVIDASDVEGLKQYAKDTVADNTRKEINSYIASGDLNTAITMVEDAYSKGTIDKDAYQATYFDASLKNAANASDARSVKDFIEDIDSLLKEGKLSKADHDSLKSYVASRNGISIPNSKKYKVDLSGDGIKVTVGGKTYYPEYHEIHAMGYSLGKDYIDSEGKDAPTYKLLNALSTNKNAKGKPVSGSLAFLDDNMYLYDGGEWYRLDDKDGLSAKLKTSTSDAPPKHSK